MVVVLVVVVVVVVGGGMGVCGGGGGGVWFMLECLADRENLPGLCARVARF